MKCIFLKYKTKSCKKKVKAVIRDNTQFHISLSKFFILLLSILFMKNKQCQIYNWRKSSYVILDCIDCPKYLNPERMKCYILFYISITTSVCPNFLVVSTRKRSYWLTWIKIVVFYFHDNKTTLKSRYIVIHHDRKGFS